MKQVSDLSPERLHQQLARMASIYGFRDVLLEDIDWPHGTRMRHIYGMPSETYCSNYNVNAILEAAFDPIKPLSFSQLVSFSEVRWTFDVRKKCEGVLDLVQHFRRANQGDDEDLRRTIVKRLAI